jgi:FxLD family lantipeptide
MAPLLAPDRTDAPRTNPDDEDFVLDMRVIESTTPLVIMMCSTSDGCGSSCSTSACATKASDLP